jgi:hypothetical protein
MITQADIEFHTPSDVAHDWAETYFFDIFVPEANLHGFVYFVFRAGVGAVVCDVEFYDRVSANPFDARYIDLQNHLPIPERLSSFSLPNGASLAVSSPTSYRVDYVGIDETEVHLDVNGIMDPYDIHDPDIDPLAQVDPQAAVEHSGFGTAYASHFDLTCRVVGSVRVRGQEHAVDCVATMDHSWGPRPERRMNMMAYMNAHFDDLVLQSIWSFDRHGAPGAQHAFKHGYALVDGRTRGGTAGSLLVARDGLLATHLELTLTDVDGVTHRVSGTPVNNHIWMSYGCCPTATGMVDWVTEDGRRGIGTIMEAYPLDLVTGGYMDAAPAADIAAAATPR